jgi:4-hydroxybenzoate polyprenyltransferase
LLQKLSNRLISELNSHDFYADATPGDSTRVIATFKAYLEAIKFSHTIFAMPFALMACILAFRGGTPPFAQVVWIIVAMIGARTWAMAVNRFADAEFDALNPRTATRAVANGTIKKSSMLAFALLGATVFVAAAAALSRVALLCSVPVLLILGSYSYAKRVSFLCHFWLGICLGLAPLGAWVALRGTLPAELLLLSAGITFWVGGFDIIYALQDAQFDAGQGLKSIPSRFGLTPALWIARVSHLAAAIFFALFGVIYNLGLVYFAGLGLAALLMVQQHAIVRKGSLEKINFAFFNLNGWIAVLLFLAAGISLWLEPVL